MMPMAVLMCAAFPSEGPRVTVEEGGSRRDLTDDRLLVQPTRAYPPAVARQTDIFGNFVPDDGGGAR